MGHLVHLKFLPSDLDDDFVEKFEEMFKHIAFSKKDSTLPKIYGKRHNGEPLKCRGLYHFVKNYQIVLQQGISLDIKNYLQVRF